MDKKKLLKRAAIVCALIAAVVLLCNIGNIKKAYYYRKAVDYICQEEYAQASAALREINDKKYKESGELDDFCYDLEKYEEGKHLFGPDDSEHYDFETVKLSANVEKKRIAINQRLDEQQKEKKQELEQRKKEQSAATKQKQTTTQETTTKFSTRISGSGSFGGRGYSGNVPYSRDKSGGSSSSKKSTTKPATTKEYDPYHAADYIHPDDFYYDYYDDFYDYEDAEDYWYEHQ
ncbi:MAG: hypothetical protein IJI67_03575 [Clostridia bacterium]|nr:hypothetical protein [Clostridia bacterium]